MTDKFEELEIAAPSYLDGIYVLDWSAMSVKRATAADPKEACKRASGDKVAIQFKYCSTELGLSKRTFREALQKSNHHDNECWINTLYDNYEQTLLRAEKKRNLLRAGLQGSKGEDPRGPGQGGGGHQGRPEHQ